MMDHKHSVQALVIALLMVLICLGLFTLRLVAPAGQAAQGIATLTGGLESDRQAAEKVLASDHAAITSSFKQHDQDIFRLTQVIGRTAIDVQKSAAAIQEASGAQVKYWNENSTKFGLLLDSSNETVKQTKQDLADFDLLIKDPSLADSLKNIDKATWEGAQAMEHTHIITMNLEGISGDAKAASDHALQTFLHPTKWSRVEDILLFGARVCKWYCGP